MTQQHEAAHNRSSQVFAAHVLPVLGVDFQPGAASRGSRLDRAAATR
jgi:hypothetical protein